MSNPNESGTMAIQVSPADLTALIEFAERMVSVGQALRVAQEQVRNLSYDNEQYKRSCDNWAKDYAEQSTLVGDLRNRLSLLETQNAGTEAELERVRVSLASMTSERDLFQRRSKVVEDDMLELDRKLIAIKAERDDAQFQALEVSEALAQANATLDKFRNLLGITVGPATYSVVREWPTDPAPVAAAPTEPVPVSSPLAPTIPVESYVTADSGVGTSGYREEPLKEDHQNEPQGFPSPAPTVEPSQSGAGSEHGSSGPNLDHRWPHY